MISFGAQGRFAAEFVAFLVAVGGLALVALRAELLSARRASRATLALGFSLIAVGSFLVGSLVVSNHDAPASIALRAAGVVFLVVGSRQWAGGANSRWVLWLGLLGVAVAQVLLATHMEVGADIALGLGAAAVGVALRLASRRSIAASVAAGTAAILLVVVLVLAVSLSAVLSTTVRDDAGRRLDARAALEEKQADSQQPALMSIIARTVAFLFASNTAYQQAAAALVHQPNPNSGHLPDVATNPLYTDFKQTEEYLAPDAALAFVNQSGYVYGLAAPQTFDQRVVADAIGSQAVREVFSHSNEPFEVSVLLPSQSTAFVVAVQNVDVVTRQGGNSYPTAIVAIQPLGDSYLRTRQTTVDSSVSLYIANRTGVLGRSDRGGPSDRVLLDLAHRSLDNGGVSVPLTLTDGRLLSVEPILAGSQPVAVMIAATPDTVVTGVRDKLLRTFFLLALAGTLLALALAAYAGERVSGGIRLLTGAAERIRQGDFSPPPPVRSEDEVGVLSAAFDAMTTSISAQTGALQRAAEEEAALRGQLEGVVAGMGEALIAIDADGRVTLFNRAAEELLGLDSERVLGRLVGEVLDAIGEDGTPLAARLQRPTPGRWHVTASVASELGPRIPAAISSGALRGANGGVIGAALVLRDLRPEREVERIKSEFLSRIGHELRTPLTGILGYAEILLRRPMPPDRARDMYQQIVDAGRRLYRVVQMLEFSAAAEAGRSLLRDETVDVREVVSEVVNGWSARVNGNHALASRVGRRIPPVRGDRRWLVMAIDELIDNAIKFSPDGGTVGVTARAVTIEQDGQPADAVQVSVVDTGVGMSESDLRDAFAEFVQADGSDTRRFGGLGLGLSLVKRVVEAHGGRVDVESTPQKGSKFSFIIPVLPND